MRSITKRFKEALSKAKDKPYEPKFKEGDFIYNKKYDTLRKVNEVIKFEWDKSGKMTQYNLANVHNILTTHKTALKDAIRIDAYYIKVNEKAAKILYGKNNN